MYHGLRKRGVIGWLEERRQAWTDAAYRSPMTYAVGHSSGRGHRVVQVRQAGPEARARLAKQGRGYVERQPYRQAILGLEGNATVELIADEGESMRRLKLLTSRAAQEVGRGVKYGVTQEGSLLIWLAAQDATPQKRTRRRRTSDPADLAAEVQ